MEEEKKELKDMFLIANIVTTSKALVTTSDALVTNSTSVKAEKFYFGGLVLIAPFLSLRDALGQQRGLQWVTYIN